ncbi:hypothetical protein X975_20538, partial [Stegodyphus mimosarum]
MKMCNKSKMARRYISDILFFAYSLYIKSAACNHCLYDSQLTCLPSNDHLRKILPLLKLDGSTSNETDSKYVKGKAKKLLEHEKLVNLLIDEVHVKKKVNYKGKTLIGFAENFEGIEATSVQSFMISSLFSDYKDIIALVPVNKMTAVDLHSLILRAL